MAAKTRIQFRRGYSTSYPNSLNSGTLIAGRPTAPASGFVWAANSKLDEGEIGYEIDTGKFKIGRYIGGFLADWSVLPYAGGSELLAQSGIGYSIDPNNNSYTLYSTLVGDDSNITLSVAQMSELLNGASGTYYKIGLADNLSSINNISITGNLSSVGGTFTGNVNVTGQLTTAGSIVSNNVDITSIINKLIPAQPPVFPGSQTLSLSTSSVSRTLCSGFSIANNNNISMPSGGQIASGVIFTSSYVTNSITGVGPGTAGTVSATKNTVSAGSGVMTTGVNNGTYSDLIISNDRDYSAISSVASGFWQSFDARASGTSLSGWNTLKLGHSQGQETNLISWYFDNTTLSPVITNVVVSTGVGTLSYSSSVPHYSGTFNASFDIQNVSSDTFRTVGGANEFIDAISTTSASNAIDNVGAISRASAGLLATPTRNYGVGSPLSANINGLLSARSNSFASIASGSFAPNTQLYNSLTSATLSLRPNATTLIKTIGVTDTGTILREDNIPVGITNTGAASQLGASSTAYGIRISGFPNTTDTPASGTLSTWNSLAPLGSGDAALVGGIIRHDITNYSTGYIPSGGPNLSTGGRSSSVPQYFTFQITRSAVSTLKIRIASTTGIDGLWFKLPGTADMDNKLTNTNGWASAFTQYNSSTGFTATNIGCAITSTVPSGTSLNASNAYDITFGTANSTLTTPANTIYVRTKLSSGQSISSIFIHQ